jgi:hypothetical protein
MVLNFATACKRISSHKRKLFDTAHLSGTCGVMVPKTEIRGGGKKDASAWNAGETFSVPRPGLLSKHNRVSTQK